MIDEEKFRAIRKKALTEAISVLCDKCRDGVVRVDWNGNPSHAMEDLPIRGVVIRGHFACPANPVWKLMEAA